MASEKAEALVIELGVKSPPIDLINLLKELDIKLVKKDLENEFAGAALREGEEKIIVVSNKDSNERQRFTIAHELGHLILHSDSNLHVDKYFRNNKSSHGTDPKEMEANRFAAELLMPRIWLEEDLSTLNVDLNEKEDESWINSLAKKYKVSKQALIVRLSSLNLLTL